MHAKMMFKTFLVTDHAVVLWIPVLRGAIDRIIFEGLR